MADMRRPLTKGDIYDGSKVLIEDAETGDQMEFGVCHTCSALYRDLVMHMRSHGGDPYGDLAS